MSFGIWLHALCEAQGYKVSEIEDGAWEVMATAVEYKMRTLIEQSIRVTHRTQGSNAMLDANAVLTATRLLHWNHRPRIGCRGALFSHAADDEELVLDDFLAEETSLPLPPVPRLDFKWLFVNGVVCENVHANRPGHAADLRYNLNNAVAGGNKLTVGPAPRTNHSWCFKSFDGFHRDFVKTQGEHEGDGSLFLKVLLEKCDRRPPAGALQSVLVIPKSLDRYLSDEYKLYLQRLMACIVGILKNCGHRDLEPIQRAQDKLALAKIMQSLNEGPAPSKLVPFVFALICGVVPPAVAEGPPEAVLITLHVLISYVQNPRVHAKPYLHQIIQAFLLALLAPTMGPMEPASLIESLNVRKLASEGLGFVSKGFAVVPAAFNSVVEILSATLKTSELPLTTLIGAIMGCAALGEEAVRMAVRPLARNLIAAVRSEQPTHPATALTKAKAELTNFLLELLTTTLNRGEAPPGGGAQPGEPPGDAARGDAPG